MVTIFFIYRNGTNGSVVIIAYWGELFEKWVISLTHFQASG